MSLDIVCYVTITDASVTLFNRSKNSASTSEAMQPIPFWSKASTTPFSPLERQKSRRQRAKRRKMSWTRCLRVNQKLQLVRTRVKRMSRKNHQVLAGSGRGRRLCSS